MPGILEFTLGLKNAEFLSELGVSARELVSFEAVAEGVRFSAEKMWAAMEHGAQLGELKAVTGETVSNLYRLGEGMRGVGLDAGMMNSMFMYLQKSLSGLSDSGQNTTQLFARLGLSRSQLAAESPVAAINEISGALSKLGRNDAFAISSGLFTRFAAMDFMQLAGEADLVQKVMRETAGDSKIFSAFADDWKAIAADVVIFKSHIEAIWGAIAGGITPEMYKVMEYVNGITKDLGAAIAGAFQFKEVGTLLEDALDAALEQGSYYGVKVFISLAAAFGDALRDALKLALTDFIPMYFNGIKNAALLAGSMAMQKVFLVNAELADRSNNPRAAEQDRAAAARQAQYQAGLLNADGAAFDASVADAMKNVGDATRQIIADVAASIKADPKRPHAKFDKLLADAKDLAKAWTASHPDAPAGGSHPEVAPLESKYKSSATDFEKMGFVMGGAVNPLQETNQILRQIQRNTSAFHSAQGAFFSVQGAFNAV